MIDPLDPEEEARLESRFGEMPQDEQANTMAYMTGLLALGLAKQALRASAHEHGTEDHAEAIRVYEAMVAEAVEAQGAEDVVNAIVVLLLSYMGMQSGEPAGSLASKSFCMSEITRMHDSIFESLPSWVREGLES